jgi:SAM-dependent methyltransferase
MPWLKKFLKIILPGPAINWLNAKKENLRFRSWRILWSLREWARPQKFYHDPFQTDEFYWINPRSIHYRTLQEFKYYQDHNRVIGGDWDLGHCLFDEDDFYRAFSEHMNEGKQWSETEYYTVNLEQINAGKVKWGCKNKNEWDDRFRGLNTIYQDIKNIGYSPQKIEDYISVNIGRHGHLLFNDGRHRLTFCRILAIPEIPIRITARHAKWVMFKNQIFEYTQSRDGKVYAPLSHIDLQNIPAGYSHRRFELIRDNLTIGGGGQLLDLGSHWGYFCHKFEEIGFNCLAVENDPENRYFLKKLHLAEERQFSVFEDSMFELDLGDKYFDVVLALAVFHHLTKKEKSYHQLIRFLKNLRVGEIFFQPPDPSEPQMQSAFRNFENNEFAEFIIEHTSLQNYIEIGLAEDGRKLYKIF